MIRDAALKAGRLVRQGRISELMRIFWAQWMLVFYKLTGRDSREEKWRGIAQRGELAFHRTNKWRQSEDFDRSTAALFEYFGFDAHEYDGKTIVDLGAGSKLRTKFFKNAELIVIEPLADEFLRDIAWSDLKDASFLYSRPAEELIDEVVGQADLVMSINVLDHCFALEKIIENIVLYMRPDALAFLSFDSHAPTADGMHPLTLDEDSCEKIFLEKGLVVERRLRGLGPGGSTYGHGEALSFWLRKSVSELVE